MSTPTSQKSAMLNRYIDERHPSVKDNSTKKTTDSEEEYGKSKDLVKALEKDMDAATEPGMLEEARKVQKGTSPPAAISAAFVLLLSIF